MASSIDGSSFDFVVVGTGLSESILSAALSIQGHTVLHIDSHDHYGGEEATLAPRQLNALPAWTAASRGLGRMAPSHNDDGDGKASTWPAAWTERGLDRHFNLDVGCRLVLCRGEMVDALVRSGVSQYVEFKALEDALMLDADDVVMRVPCSKAQVFKSRDISMGEKRQLMRFLQHCMDESTRQRDGAAAVRSRNEAGLNQGRSLPRPQCKTSRGYDDGDSAGAKDGDSTGAKDGDSAGAEEAAREAPSLAGFLADTCGLSPRLCRAVAYAVALLPGPERVDKDVGMQHVQRYLGGLGRFGRTAFLCPIYGMSEVSQAFCRLSSVHGGVFMLRQTLTRARPGEESGVRLTLATGESVTAGHVVSGRSFVMPGPEVADTADEAPANNPSEVPTDVADATASEVPANSANSANSANIASEASEVPADVGGRRELHLVCVANGPVVSLLTAAPSPGAASSSGSGSASMGSSAPSSGSLTPELRELLGASAVCGRVEQRRFPEQARCVLVVPPAHAAIGNAGTVFAVQLDNGVDVAAPGYFALHLSTVASADDGVLHRAAAHLLARAREALAAVDVEVAAEAEAEAEGGLDVQFQALFARNLDAAQDVGDVEQQAGARVHRFGVVGLGLDMHEYVEQARAMFEELCPGEAFLPSEAERKDEHRVERTTDVDDVFARVRIPQPVDLQHFQWQGGRLDADATAPVQLQ